MMYPMIAVLAVVANPIVYFVIVAVLIALAMFYLPRLLPLDAQIWGIIRVVVIIALILWALRLFGIL